MAVRPPNPRQSDRSREGVEGRRIYPVAAVLLALAAPLGPLSNNLQQATLAEAAPALLGSLAFALAVWLIAVVVRRRADAGAALTAAIWVVGSLYYLELVRHLNAVLGGDYAMVRPLPIALAVMALLTVAVCRGTRSHVFVRTVLTCMALVIVATPVWRIVAFELRHGAARSAYDADQAAAELPVPADPGGAVPPPDIYHVVFDRYGSEDTLARHFGIGEPVGAFLESRGFYVARDSFSNYLSTGHSLASTFFMDYLTLDRDPRVLANNWHPIFAMLDDHRVGRFLRARGYTLHQVGSWWVGTQDNPFADSSQSFGLTEFDMTYFRRTILLPVFHLLGDRRLDWDNGQCQRVARQIEAIKRLGEEGEGPVYVFAHILVPHGPNVFAPDGRCLTRPESTARGETQGYIEQVAYADVIIEDLVTTLQSGDRAPAVILIQADEGPIPERDRSVPWQDATAEELGIKFGILNAFYFPNGDYSRLRQDITPINAYRALFGTLFQTEFEELPDRMIAFPDDSEIYEFHDVTERVRCVAAASAPIDDEAVSHC